MQVLIYSGYYHEHQKLYDDIFGMTRSIGNIYPKYREWYYNTFLEDLKRGNRSYAIATHHMIISGCCLMKNTPNEKKICTLFVKSPYRRQGVGTDLMQAAFTELGEHPFLTVSLDKLSSFSPFLKRLGFQMKLLPKQVGKPPEALFYRPTPRCITRKQDLLPQPGCDKVRSAS